MQHRSTEYPPQEDDMNREFNTTSMLTRSILAAVAALSTVLVIGSIDGLAQHYGADAQMAAAATTVVARN